MTHVCEGLYPLEICDDGEVWAPCEAEVCREPCRRVGLCECACHIGERKVVLGIK